MGEVIPEGFRRYMDVRNEMGAAAFKSALNVGHFEVYRLDDRTKRLVPVPRELLLTMNSHVSSSGEWNGPIWPGGPRVRQLMLVKEPGIPTDMTTPPAKSRGGRPSKWDWPGAAGFAAGYIVENDYPAKQGEVVDIITNWFKLTAGGHQPDDRQIERFVSELYKRGKT